MGRGLDQVHVKKAAITLRRLCKGEKKGFVAGPAVEAEVRIKGGRETRGQNFHSGLKSDTGPSLLRGDLTLIPAYLRKGLWTPENINTRRTGNNDYDYRKLHKSGPVVVNVGWRVGSSAEIWDRG